jgi:geranylgeranyl reductase family protein
VTRDVVIVGAGPAGSVAAAALARRGRDVLLLDRAGFPRDKPCGDGIPPGTVEILDELGMSAALREVAFHPIRGIRLVSPLGRDWQVHLESRRPPADFFIAPRLTLDDLIRRHAVACGAEFRSWPVHSLLTDGERVVGVRAVIDGVNSAIPARVVIGADGATSVVARALRGDRAPACDRAVAIRAYVDGIQTVPHTVELHWYRGYAPGYGWIFPTGPSSANVGVIVRSDRFKRRGVPLVALLDRFMRARDVRDRLDTNASVRGTATWQLPYATPRTRTRAFDGALLIGDAGRLVDSLTGEGIHAAVASATIAADVVDRALARGDASRSALAEFDARCERKLGPLIRRSYRVQKHLAVHPLAVETVFLAARMGGRAFTRWLDRTSSDFFVTAPSAE